MADFDAEDWNEEIEHIDSHHQNVDVAPDDEQLLGPWTLVALMLNRTIGSGIFVSPQRVLIGTGSVGVSLILWSFGAFVSTCGVLVWLELGLSVPFREVKVTPGPHGKFEKKSVPRNGGEKNYLEFLYSNPNKDRPGFLVTCMYGIPFILLGNLAGNALALGSFVMHAVGRKPDDAKGEVIGIAIGTLSAACLLHMFSRRGGIIMNNLFAVIKVLLLVVIIVLGFLKAGGVHLGGSAKATENFRISESFAGAGDDFASYTSSLQQILYSYSGYLQPFYVLAEVARPRKVFPKYTLIGMLITTILFILVNVSYFCVVPRDLDGIAQAQDMASVFFAQTFGNELAQRVMNGFTAFSILGNIVVMTFTAARVKQEIAKEGILPFSLFFAKGSTTPWARIKERFSRAGRTKASGESTDEDELQTLEQTPMAALALHWFTSIALIAFTAKMQPTRAYFVLVGIYIYSIRLLVGAFVSGGLIILKLTPSRNWKNEVNITFWSGYWHIGLFFITDLFLLITAFVKPGKGSPWSYENAHIPWYIAPTIGLSTLIWGLVWCWGLHGVMLKRSKTLIVTRRVLAVKDRGDPDQWIQKGEIVTHEWHTHVPDLRPGRGV
ncbi:amino acid permease-domain-containing protein [Phaeosphaeriaceae sp. PMI808]|nr:amino acid permease-domain-containing protein [Phaeosphaeriaceae sp. PMI808]